MVSSCHSSGEPSQLLSARKLSAETVLNLRLGWGMEGMEGVGGWGGGLRGGGGAFLSSSLISTVVAITASQATVPRHCWVLPAVNTPTAYYAYITSFLEMGS